MRVLRNIIQLMSQKRDMPTVYSTQIKCLHCGLGQTAVTYSLNYEMKKRAIACLEFASSGLVPLEKIILRVLCNII